MEKEGMATFGIEDRIKTTMHYPHFPKLPFRTEEKRKFMGVQNGGRKEQERLVVVMSRFFLVKFNSPTLPPQNWRARNWGKEIAAFSVDEIGGKGEYVRRLNCLFSLPRFEWQASSLFSQGATTCWGFFFLMNMHHQISLSRTQESGSDNNSISDTCGSLAPQIFWVMVPKRSLQKCFLCLCL